ncbi:fatty acid desaturase [Allocatelliglobosispora scoriae]|uniref:Fatty acid desaturase n=1 Tax=Allocatelliglobosispora scoriae TaxID=643052 RepID=A0A841C6Q3_9ACTN|nr:fatty acid desaturase family protein [Allocatelliglobosispora scoriae]MBB5874461.1 fatty acid desaturase [Allocatelliglobosispora scoriae]
MIGWHRYRFIPAVDEGMRQLNVLDNWHGLVAYTRDVLLLILSVAACVRLSWWCYPLALIVIGSRQRAFSNLLHESAHGTLAANRRLNLMLGTVCAAYPIFQLHFAYKHSHVTRHHPHLGDPAADPDLRHHLEQGVYGPATTRFRLLVAPALGSKVAPYLWHLVRDRFLGSAPDTVLSPAWRRRMRRDRIAFQVFWLIVLAACAATGNLTALLLFWIVPFLTVFQVIGWYIELAEHTPLALVNDVDLHMTRNRRSRGIELFLTGTYADNLHLDHHLDPRTPYWNLRAARRLRLADPGYAAVDAGFGGLFRKGPQGQPSALAAVLRDLDRLPAELRR